MLPPLPKITPEIEEALSNPPFEGSSVPATREQAQRYALRLEHRFYEDQRKQQRAIVRLNALAEICVQPLVKQALVEVARSLW